MAVNGWLIFFGLLWAHIVLLIWLHKSGRMQKWRLSLMLGLVLMIRTDRGKGSIEAVSKPKKFWNAFGDLGIVTTLVGMVGMTALMAYGAYGAFRIGGDVEPFGITDVIIIPGVTSFVPLWYGIAGLIVALVVHEGGHGVLARANNLKVKSLGLLYAIVPIGAFVEPDEDELAAASRRRRLRVFSAGAMVNLVVAGLLLVAMGAIAAEGDAKPGVPVLGVIDDSAADLAGLQTGDILVAINGTPTPTNQAFSALMDTTSVNQTVDLTISDGRVLTATLGDRWSDSLNEEQWDIILSLPDAANRTSEHDGIVAYCNAHVGEGNYTDGGECADGLRKSPFLGIHLLPADRIQGLFTDPFGDGGRNFAMLMYLPIGEINDQPYLSMYLPTFFEEPFAGGWIVFTLLFWIFWINLMLGLTNILPLLPLDGGHIFRDAVGGLLERVKPTDDPVARDRFVGRLAAISSFTILGLFLFTILAPRIL